jgi:putative transposase
VRTKKHPSSVYPIGEAGTISLIERKNGSNRKELLDVYFFYNLEDVRLLTEQWHIDYNKERPHEAPGNVPPAESLKPLSSKN